ncbi:MAG: hypothetical protein K2Q14_01470 [Gammaproteobacteria bacterium]|nr:hypothetical protein [Nitrosomonas sp.]MBY0544200.1 hypothetical protein [Gammaproteobacteria bacterium]
MQHKKSFIGQTIIGVLLISSSVSIAETFPDYGYTPPSDWSGATFQLSQQYPKIIPSSSSFPWQKIDFREEPEKYLWAVLNYCFEGNLQTDFLVQNNTIRLWYHAPWLHYGANGRDFVKGLTRERSSRPFELSPSQSQQFRNYAVGFYNDLGGFTIGQVWNDPQKPDVNNIVFPEGTVSFKLLFTTAPESIADFLTDAPEWMADVDRAQTAQQVLATKVRLLQIDIAVKDNRSSKGGWIFGTFHYDSGVNNPNPWLRLRPLTLMWGDDPSFVPSDYQSGSRPAESWINTESPIVKYRSNPPSGSTPPSTLGWAGRGNGPVDNPLSSCMSCHSTAQIPASSPIIAPANLSDEEKLRWFRNTKVGEAFDSGSKTLDFSLQLGVGIQNLKSFKEFTENLGGISAVKHSMKILSVPATDMKSEYQFSRD